MPSADHCAFAARSFLVRLISSRQRMTAVPTGWCTEVRSVQQWNSRHACACHGQAVSPARHLCDFAITLHISTSVRRTRFDDQEDRHHGERDAQRQAQRGAGCHLDMSQRSSADARLLCSRTQQFATCSQQHLSSAMKESHRRRLPSKFALVAGCHCSVKRLKGATGGRSDAAQHNAAADAKGQNRTAPSPAYTQAGCLLRIGPSTHARTMH
jgi:hypothetical protein